MKTRVILKSLGIWLVLIGVLILALPFFLDETTNAGLLVGLAFVVGGFVYYILSNKYL